MTKVTCKSLTHMKQNNKKTDEKKSNKHIKQNNNNKTKQNKKSVIHNMVKRLVPSARNRIALQPIRATKKVT